VSGQLHAPAALPPGKSPRYPFYKRLGGPQSRSGRYGEVKIFYPTGTQTPAPPGRPARSQSLYRMSSCTIGFSILIRRISKDCPWLSSRASFELVPKFHVKLHVSPPPQTPAQLLSPAHLILPHSFTLLHFPALYLLSNLPFPKGRMGATSEPSKPEITVYFPP
jgi:hypothetical protein